MSAYSIALLVAMFILGCIALREAISLAKGGTYGVAPCATERPAPATSTDLTDRKDGS